MAQCTEGYRMSQLLKNIGVVDDKYDSVITTNEEFGIDNNSNRITSTRGFKLCTGYLFRIVKNQVYLHPLYYHGLLICIPSLGTATVQDIQILIMRITQISI